MKLLTLNCHSWHEENQLAKIEWLARAIVQNDYDIIALQEVSQKVGGTPIHLQVKEDNYAYVLWQKIKELGGPSYHLHWDLSHLAYENQYEEGLAILSKVPFEETSSFYISQSDNIEQWKSRKIVKATVKVNGENVSFYSCHCGWWHDEEEPFKNQVDQLMNYIPNDEWVFLMGDFNNSAHIRGEGYDYLLKQGFYDTYDLAEEKDEGITVKGKIAGWDQNKQDLRIDLILTNRNIPVQSSAVIFNGLNHQIVSDHYGVEVTL